MIKSLLTCLSISILTSVVVAQTTILDFESPEKSTSFQYFGSPLDGSLNSVVANPDPSGENTSSMVATFVKPTVAETWAGAFSSPNPSTPVDLSSNNRIAIKVWMDHIGSVSLKLEGSTDGGPNWIITVPNTKVNAWETLVFDASIPSIETPNAAASGYSYATVVLFFDFGTGGTGADVTSYFDDIATLPPAPLFTTILDFETPEKSTTFQYFGSPLDGSPNAVVANPDPSGENTSSMVATFVKPAVAETWAGAFSNPNPTALIDLSSNNRIAIKVWMDHIGVLALKLEGSPDGGPNWVITVPNTKVNEWETLVFDASIPSIETPNAAAIGYSYARVVLFFDFGTGGTGVDVTSYFDDIVTLPPPPVVTTILDFETPASSTVFQYFGSALDGTYTDVIANPNPSGINVSDSVTVYLKPAVAQPWAGAFSNPNPVTPLILEPGSQICIKVHSDHVGNLALKLEQGASGQPNWIYQVSNTTVGEWTELCFDPTSPSIETPFEPATGTYNRVVLFFDFGVDGTGVDVTSYFDDLVVKTSGAPEPKVVNFRVDMNQYTENFDQVYISGSFNGWSGEANPLADPEFDGIWEGSIEVINGAYEYKITLDNWAGQEAFNGLEECTKRDNSGQFVNRLLLVSGDLDVPQFCFNSCYACGEEVKITFRLGLNGSTPNPDGIWLVGGGNFDIPGGKYKMQDDDADGIFEITVPRGIGFSSHYAFANGNCPDFSCKEDLMGLECGDPDNFHDRFLEETTDDVVIGTCYETCAVDELCTVSVIHPARNEKVFDLHGNPAGNAGSVLVFGQEFKGERIVTLSNAVGTILKVWELSQETEIMSLDMNQFVSGLYMVTVQTGNTIYSRKLIN